MTTDADNVYVASPATGTGGVFTAALGTALPTSTSGSIAAFTDNGLISEDGVTSLKEISSADIRSWGGKKQRNVQTEYGRKLKLTFLEANATVLAHLYGAGNVTTVDDETTIVDDGTETPHFAMVVDSVDGDKNWRYTVADARVVEQDDIVLVHSDATKFGVTIECFPDADGLYVTEYLTDGSGS